MPLVRGRNRDYRVEHSIELMKRIILSVVVLFFALAVRAEDAKVSQGAKDKDMPSCCSEKVKTSDDAKGTCPFAKTSCCKAAPAVKQTALLSPKAADLAAK